MNQGRAFWVLRILISIISVAAFAKDYPAVPGEYVVRLKSTTSIMSRTNLASALNAEVVRTVSENMGMILVKRPMVETRESAMQLLAANPLVQYAEPNYIYRAFSGSTTLPDISSLKDLWGMINTGQKVTGDAGDFNATAGIDINAKKAWEVETGSTNVIVAVIDTGVDYKAPGLAGNIFINQPEFHGKPGVDDDNNGYVDDIYGFGFVDTSHDPMDGQGHGTHVSNTIGGNGKDPKGVVGVAWNVTIMPVRFLNEDGTGKLSDAVSAIEYAVKMKANIMNNSWGGGPYTQSMYDMISKAKDAGILFVAAAGNEYSNNDSTPTYPASYQLDNIISVAAIDPTGNKPDWSNYGAKSVHIAAPGVDILSYTRGSLQSFSGTSMATPHVVGVAALMLSHDPTLTYTDIKTRIIKSSRALPSMSNKSVGGLVDAYAALTTK